MMAAAVFLKGGPLLAKVVESGRIVWLGRMDVVDILRTLPPPSPPADGIRVFWTEKGS